MDYLGFLGFCFGMGLIVVVILLGLCYEAYEFVRKMWRKING